MKTSKGFTLIELLVVIAIISILATMTLSLDFNRSNAALQRDRFVSKAISMLESARLDAITGKTMGTGNVDNIRVTFSTGGTDGRITIYYMDGDTLVNTGETLSSPFFGNTAYRISDIQGINTDNSRTSTQDGTIVFAKNSTTFTGSFIYPQAIRLEIELAYQNQTGAIEIDRRTGRIGKVGK